MGSAASSRTEDVVVASNTMKKAPKEFPVSKTKEEWRKQLTSAQFEVLREHGTERPFTSPLNKVKSDGVFKCVGCSQKLFKSSGKFDSGTGWPSFFEAASPDAVAVKRDYSYGMARDEVLCSQCGGHLGHVFDDGPRDKTGLRYCINGVCLAFEKEQ